MTSDALDDGDPEREADPSFARGSRRAPCDCGVSCHREQATRLDWRSRRGRESQIAAAARCAAARSVEEAVHRRAGSADVGTERPGGEEIGGERRRGEVVRRQLGEIARGRCAVRRSRGARPAAPRSPRRPVEAAIDGAGRPLTAPAGARAARCSPAAARPARASSRRRFRAAGPAQEEGHVGAEAARERRAARPAGSGSWSVAFASRSAAAASELPPPRPAATGIRFSIRPRQRGSTPAAAATASSAARGRCVSSVEARRRRGGRPARPTPCRRGRSAGARSRPRGSRLASARRRRGRG